MKTKTPTLISHRLVRGTRNRQITIPKPIHGALGLQRGTIYEVETIAGRVVFTPRSLANWEGMEAARKASLGIGLSPAFTDADDLIAHLHKSIGKRPKKQ